MWGVFRDSSGMGYFETRLSDGYSLLLLDERRGNTYNSMGGDPCTLSKPESIILLHMLLVCFSWSHRTRYTPPSL